MTGTGQVTLSETMLIADTPASGTALDAAMAELVRRHAHLAYQIAYSVLRNHHDAEDASQEVFLRVWKFRRKLEDVGDTKAWIARIAWRVAIERRPRRSSVSFDDADYASLRDGLKDGATDAESQAADRQMQRWLETEIGHLPEDLRAPLLLSTVKELNSAEIAEVLKIADGTVRTRLFRARERLKERLAKSLEKSR